MLCARTSVNKETPSAKGKPLSVTGETLPEAAEITLKQEKEALEQAELIPQQEKVIL